MASNFAIKYPASMKEHPYGHAFYEPESASVVYPGACGYLNDEGQWQPIADLTDEMTLQEKGLISPQTLVKSPPKEHQWGPKASNSVRFKKLGVNLTGSGASAGMPAEASLVYDFWSLASFGALLVCPSKVLQQGYYHKEPFRQWAKQNATNILSICPDAKEQGFYVVTTTYSTDDIWVNAWNEKGTHVAIGFKAGVAGEGEIAPSGEFYRADSASGWTHSTKEGEDQKVVFFSGLQFKYRKLPLGRSSIKEVRGEEVIVVSDPIKQGDLYQLEVEAFGSNVS